MHIAPPDILAARLKALSGALKARALDAVVVTSLPNIAYLTGFFASAAALVATRAELFLIGDGRYAQSLADRAREFPAVRAIELPTGASYDQTLVDDAHAARRPGGRFRIEPHLGPASQIRHLARWRKRGGRTVSPMLTGLWMGCGCVKDQWEVGRLRDGAAKTFECR